MFKTAKWIWIDKYPQKNLVLAARGNFTYTSGEVSLTIGADTLYQLYVNGVFVGHGPVRSFPENTRLDTYDITPCVRRGKNTVAVQVLYHGCSTFKNIAIHGGLIAEVTCKGKVLCATGKDWKITRNTAYSTSVPRVSGQQAWTETFDARKDLAGWTSREYNDSKWETPDIIEDGPWTNLSERDIPHLTYKPEYPIRVHSLRSVGPPKHALGFDSSVYFLPGVVDDEPTAHDGIIAMGFECARAMTVKIATLHYKYPALKIDNEPVDDETLRKGVKLGAGKHLFAVNCCKAAPGGKCSRWHDNGFTVMFDCNRGDIKFTNPLDGSDTPFAIAAPYHDDSLCERIWAVDFDDTQLFEDWAKVDFEGVKANPKFKVVDSKDIFPEIVFGDVVEATEFDDEPKVENLGALCVPSAGSAVIYPGKHHTEVTVDFGSVRSGYLEFELIAPKGVTVDFYGYEFISGDTIRHTRVVNNTLRYITRDGLQHHRSPVRRGVRYGVLTFRFPKGVKEPVIINDFHLNESLFPYTQKGRFLSSDYVLNEIYNTCLRTLRTCSEDTYVDCPTFEQTFWVGDSKGSSLFAYMAFGEYRLAERCFRLAAESLSRSPMVESQVPSGWRNIIPAWSFMWSMGCYEHYMYTGNREFLAEMYPHIKKQLDNINERFINRNGLFEIAAWNFFDWAKMDTPDKGVVTHQNLLLIMTLRSAAETARVLGFDEDAAEFDKRADSLKRAVNKHLRDNRRRIYIDSIHEDGTRSKVVSRQVQTLAYLADVIKPSERSIFRKYIEKGRRDFIDFGTPFAMTVLIEALLKAGKPEAAVRITRDTWRIITDADTGTCWEFLPTSGLLNVESRSYCQAYSATPAFTMPAAVLGVMPLEPGFKKFTVNPCLETLDWAKGVVPTPQGEITVSVRKAEDNKLRIELNVPPEAVAVIEDEELFEGDYDIILE